MSSVFKSPKVSYVQPATVEPEVVDDSQIISDLEKKRKKKMGAISQLISLDRNSSDKSGAKKTLGA